MDIKYKILSFEPKTGSMQVNYYSDEVPEGLTYAIDIPVQDGQFASQDLVDNLIKTFEPRGQLIRIAEVSGALVPDHLSQYIQTPQDPADQANASIPTQKDMTLAIQEAILAGKTALDGVTIPQDTISFISSE